MLFILFPLAIVKSLLIMIINPFSIFHIISPISIIIVLISILIFSFTMFLSILKISFINRGLATIIFQYNSPTMKFIIIKLAYIFKIGLIKIVCSLSKHFLIFYSSLISITIGKLKLILLNILCDSLRYFIFNLG